ncbi:MAG: ABC-2 family transporter protein [Patescibacteria group bacterium]
MKKYLTVINVYWQRALAYRSVIIAYRAGEMAEVLILILMWTSIYGKQDIIKGFTLPEMITYVLIGNLFSVITRNFLTNVVAHDIKDGRLSSFLLQPISYFNFILSRELGRLSFAFLMSVSSQVVIILFFLNKFIFNSDIIYLSVILIMIILAFITELLISYLIGLIAFWADEVDGIYATVDRLRKFFSGGYFPLNFLPPVFVTASFSLPFAYSFFVPAQLYLKKIDILAGIRGIFIQLIWIVLLYGIIRLLWKKGLKKYEGVGI